MRLSEGCSVWVVAGEGERYAAGTLLHCRANLRLICCAVRDQQHAWAKAAAEAAGNESSSRYISRGSTGRQRR